VADVQSLEVARERVGMKRQEAYHRPSFELIVAGATRLGTSRGPDLLRQRYLGKEEQIIKVVGSDLF